MAKKKTSTTKKEQARKDNITSIVFLAIVVVGILVAILYSSGVFSNLSSGDRKINMETQKTVKNVEDLKPDITENPNISYPGYEKITLRAGKTKQKVYLKNPKENTCYFQISIILSDGRVIWKSDYLEPGNAYDRICLDEALSKGTYENTVLKYESYSIKDGRKLNGSTINMTLEVE